MENNGGLIVIVIALALLFGGGGDGSKPTPVPVIATPTAETQAALTGLKEIMGKYPEAHNFGADWRDLYSVVGSTGTKVTTNQQLRDLIGKFSTFLVTQRYASKPFDGFTKSVNDGLTKAFTDENVAIDPAKSADFILGIAWACGG